VHIRAGYTHTPIIFLTAKSPEKHGTLGLDAGAEMFLSKPISPEKLLRVVAETIG
jgi:DNA-binding response OmpR family regulator